VKLGHVSLDGTKIKANASKHKAMSYGRMNEKEKELEREVNELLRKAESVDAEEDKRYGKGIRGDELPEELQFREKRLARIRQAKKALEERVAKEAEPSQKEKQPKPKDQINFTDPESRIMKDSSTKEFMQGYNAQAAVDATSQVIVAAEVTIQSNDKKQLEPMLAEVKENCNAVPKELSADAGYYSEDNIAHVQAKGIRPLIPPGNTRHTDVKSIPPRGRIPKQLSMKERMERLLRTKKGRKAYAKRKETVEPVFGQIKDVRGFRRFLLRGLDSVKAEWQLICLTHNLLKLYRWGLAQATA
jgi:primosomal protein N''